MFGFTFVQIVSVLVLVLFVLDQPYINIWRREFLIWFCICFVVGAIPTYWTENCHWLVAHAHVYLGWYALLTGGLILLGYLVTLLKGRKFQLRVFAEIKQAYEQASKFKS